MKITPPATAPARPAKIRTMADVRAVLALDGPAYLMQAIRTLQSHLIHVDLSEIPASLDWFEEHFPKPRRGVHPRPDLNQDLAPYQKWRQEIRRSIEITSGVREEKSTRSQRNDGWAELMTAIRLHSRDGGLIHAAASGPVTKLADVCRIAGLEPWELCDKTALDRMERALDISGDRPRLRSALAFLDNHSFIPEIAALLPAGGIAQLPSSRETVRLPETAESVIERLVQKAASVRDEVVGKDSQSVSDATRRRYVSALRHHLRILPSCPADPDLGYRAVLDLSAVNDIHELFSLGHLKAGIRFAALSEEEPSVRRETIAAYYSDIITVLKRNGLITDKDIGSLKTSEYLQNGRIRYWSMIPEAQEWCRRLLSDPLMERRFRNMHRIFMSKAQEIMAAAAGRPLTSKETTRVRHLGVSAAAAAIEYAGRPIRMSNVLGLRMRGGARNFHLPSRHRKSYVFELSASETKAGKPQFSTELNVEMHGKAVMDWYLTAVRPLFPTAGRSIYLFPSVQDSAKHLDRGVFDDVFQRAASEIGLPMTFHRWRHGYASLLLREDWNNLPIAADMLGNTIGVCARSYAFVEKQALYRAGQKKMMESARRLA